MKDLYLILKNLTRNKLRLILNTFAILVAFFLFGALGSLNSALDAAVELSADDRLMVVNKINFTQPLPMSYFNKVKTLEGVNKITFANWFGTYYQDPQQLMNGMAVDPETWLNVYPEYLLDEESKQRWYQSRRGMIVGKPLADRYGWNIGDLVPISSNIFSQADGSHVWDMEVSGIFTGAEEQTYLNQLFFHHKYYSETVNLGGSDFLGWLVVSVSSGVDTQTLSETIDKQFANSPFETETASEKQFSKAFLEQLGNIGLMITSLVSAAFFTILLIVGNTMALAIRERTGEIAVLKTLGFSAPRVFRMVLFESLTLALLGGLTGLLLAKLAVNSLSSVPDIQNMFGSLVLTNTVALQSIVYMLALGLITGLIPAIRALKLNTVDALSRG
jgi:putative ABC transport system permease protein